MFEISADEARINLDLYDRDNCEASNGQFDGESDTRARENFCNR